MKEDPPDQRALRTMRSLLAILLLSAPAVAQPVDGGSHRQAVKNASTPPPTAPHSEPPLSPEDSAKKWRVREGYRIELVAAEPLVFDPVAFDWDEQGNLWVVEMADYPLGMDGNGQAGGRVVQLRDSDGDGRYDQREVIATGLNFPTGLLTWREGVLVTAAPDLLYITADGTKKVLFSGFSTGNQQLRVNGLRWGMDGWVYCAAGAHHGGYNKGTQIENRITGARIDLGSRDFRFRPNTGEFDPQSGPAQFGRARDDWGHWFGVQNSFPLWHYVLQDHDLRRNPHVIPPDPIHQLFPRNPPVHPASSLEKRFHSFDQAGRFTSACGIEIYRDRVLFEDLQTHAFSCEPFHNLVQHIVLEDDGVTFKARVDVETGRGGADASTDFLASEDRWCRPVMVRTGPDGALWVADMYRYMIEHPQWLPEQGREELLPHYRAGDDKGRIWRVVRASARHGKWLQPEVRFASANGWIRDKAQMRALWERRVPRWEEGETSPVAQAQVAWTRLLLGAADAGECLQQLGVASPRLREQALLMAARLDWPAEALPALRQALAACLNDADAKVRLQLASTLGDLKADWAGDLLAELLAAAPDGSPLQGVAMSSVLPHLERVCEHFPVGEDNSRAVGLLLRSALAVRNDRAMAALVARVEARSHISELFAVLDENQLSLAEFAAQMGDSPASAALERMRLRLEQVAATVASAESPPAAEDLALLAADRGQRELVKRLLPSLWAGSGDPQLLPLVARLRPAEVEDFLLEGWEERTPALRTQILETLLADEAWTLALLRRPEARACDAAMRARLLQHPKKAVAQVAAQAFQGSSSRAAVLEQFRPALQLTGEPERGRVVFAQACMSCHRLDGVGLDLGPDLRSVARHDAEKLFNSILDPSAIIEPGFMAYHCTLKNGGQIYGIIATETSSSLTFKLAGNQTQSVLRSEIASLKSTGASLMPDGLEAALTPQSLADLIAYLQQPR
jgi:putative membrane-bound dehydrogenase-like protein